MTYWVQSNGPERLKDKGVDKSGKGHPNNVKVSPLARIVLPFMSHFQSMLEKKRNGKKKRKKTL